jgi:hypothetical protein
LASAIQHTSSRRIEQTSFHGLGKFRFVPENSKIEGENWMVADQVRDFVPVACDAVLDATGFARFCQLIYKPLKINGY